MSEILSQEEIDALLNAIDSGAVEAEAIKEEGKKEQNRLKIYDFRRPEKFSKDQIRTFHMIFSAFARLCSTNLAGFFRTRFQLELVSIDQLTYDEFVRSVPHPTFVCIYSMLPLEGRSVMQMSLDIVFPMLDRLLGGAGSVPKNLRALTEIENRIMGGVIERSMRALREAWMNIKQIEPRVDALESGLEFIQVVPGNDMVILLSFDAEMGERTGMITIAIPYVVVEPITQNLSASLWFSGRKAYDPKNQERLKQQIEKVKLPLRVELGRTGIRLRDLLDLEVGDVVSLEKKKDRPLDILVGKKTKMRGYPGRMGNQMTVKIIDVGEGE
ncbi:MAG TPA: flagellar motor switch protein FliM [Atribacteraceae bacterium]|nr:flagellar motor switch protein FliM [Atribacteraceae bacterium]